MSRIIPIIQIDAFTHRPFGGNPAAVVLDARPLGESGAVVSGGFDGLLEFVGGGKLFLGGLSGGGFFGDGWSLGEKRRGEKQE